MSLAILVVISQMFGAPIGSLVDTSILQLLDECGAKRDFGKQRLWASVSWGILGKERYDRHACNSNYFFGEDSCVLFNHLFLCAFFLFFFY